MIFKSFNKIDWAISESNPGPIPFYTILNFPNLVQLSRVEVSNIYWLDEPAATFLNWKLRQDQTVPAAEGAVHETLAGTPVDNRFIYQLFHIEQQIK